MSRADKSREHWAGRPRRISARAATKCWGLGAASRDKGTENSHIYTACNKLKGPGNDTYHRNVTTLGSVPTRDVAVCSSRLAQTSAIMSHSSLLHNKMQRRMKTCDVTPASVPAIGRQPCMSTETRRACNTRGSHRSRLSGYFCRKTPITQVESGSECLPISGHCWLSLLQGSRC